MFCERVRQSHAFSLAAGGARICAAAPFTSNQKSLRDSTLSCFGTDKYAAVLWSSGIRNIPVQKIHTVYRTLNTGLEG